MMVEVIWFDGPCPFLTCLETARHSHPVCPKCGVVGYRNLYCDECRAHRGEEMAKYLQDLQASLEKDRALSEVE